MNEGKPIRRWNDPLREEEEIEIDLLELSGALLKSWKWIFLGTLICALAVGGWSYFMITPTYTATSKLYMVSKTEDSIVNLTELNIGTSLAADYTELIRIRDIAEEVNEALSLDYSPEEISGMLTIENVPNTRVLKISVNNASPEEAMQICNMTAEAAQRILPERTDALKPKIVEYAIKPKVKSGPDNTKNALLGGLAGFMLSSGILTLLYIMDNTFHNEEDFERTFGMIPLCVIPEGDISSESDRSEKRSSKRQRRVRKTGAESGDAMESVKQILKDTSWQDVGS